MAAYIQPFFIMVQAVCAYDSLERYAEVEGSSFHQLTTSKDLPTR
jgi:hypothetical protein